MDFCKVNSWQFLTVVSIILLLANSGTQYWSDDYARVFVGNEDLLTGSLKRAYEEYFRWTGRLTVTALTYLAINFSFQYSEYLFDTLNALAFVALLVGIFRIAMGAMPKPADGPAVLLLTTLLWLGIASIGEVALWKTGSIGYLWVVSAGVWLLVPFADYSFRNILVPLSYSHLLATFGLVLLSGLGLENYTVVVFGAQLVTIWLAIRRKARFKTLGGLIVPTALMAVAVIVLIAAPGNFMRAAAVRAQASETGSILNKLIPFTDAFLCVYANSWLTYIFAFLFWKENNRTVRLHALCYLGLSALSCYVLIAAPDIQIGGRKNFASEVLMLIGVFTLLGHAIADKSLTDAFVRRTVITCYVLLVSSTVSLFVFNFKIQQTENQRQEILADAKRNGARSVLFPPLAVSLFRFEQESRVATRIFFFDDIIGSNVAGFAGAYGASGINITVVRK